MAKRWAIETLDKTFKDIMDSQLLFGGKVIIFRGNFHQVLPVVPRDTKSKTINAIFARSYIWPIMGNLRLCTNMKARFDSIFSDFILCIGNSEKTP